MIDRIQCQQKNHLAGESCDSLKASDRERSQEELNRPNQPHIFAPKEVESSNHYTKTILSLRKLATRVQVIFDTNGTRTDWGMYPEITPARGISIPQKFNISAWN